MNKILFVVSHLGSDSSSLCNILNAVPQIQFYETKIIYNHTDAGLSLVARPHKCSIPAAIWAEELLYNHRLCHRCFYQWAQFIYVIKDAKHALHSMQPSDSNVAASNFRYYVYRLRRICEMARQTPGAILLTNLVNLKPLEGYLNLTEPLGEVSRSPVIEPCKFVTPEQVRKGQESFERHYYYLRNLELI